MPAGWIAIHRTIRNHHIVGYGKPVKPCDPSRGAYSRNEAWSDLLMECRYADGKVINGGREMELRRGELVGAISWLAARWNWTPKTVRGFIDALEADGAISVRAPGAIQGQQKGKQAHVISVCNYDKYQSQPEEEGQAKGHDLGTQKASNGQATGNIIRKDNKDKQITTLQGATDFKALETQLLDACNGALDNPVNCQGLLSLATPLMWLDQGADLNRDVLPTLQAIGKRDHGKRIRTWDYFTPAVAQAKATRLAGLPDVQPRKTKTPMGSDWSEIAKKAREQEGRQ